MPKGCCKKTIQPLIISPICADFDKNYEFSKNYKVASLNKC